MQARNMGAGVPSHRKTSDAEQPERGHAGFSGYYFALPRLLARWSGGSTTPSEQNRHEAAIAGALVHAITLVFAVSLLLASRPLSHQLLMLIPVALLVLIWWSIFFYANALLIKAVRASGFLGTAADRHLQSISVGIATTLFAWHLIVAGSWMRLLGLIWIGAVALNLTAAAVLALMHAEPAP